MSLTDAPSSSRDARPGNATAPFLMKRFWSAVMLIGALQPVMQVRAEVSSAPAFGAAQLIALPATDWITNGGNLYNQRYSPLDLINRGNVAQLKGLWVTHMGTGAVPNHSAEAQVLSYEGTLFVSNAASEVLALDVATGKILWSYQANPDPESGNPHGKSSRGVALGEGKVFVGQIDAKLVALDQRTGKVIWSIQAEPWQPGFSITSAPLYYDGLVVTGFTGGDDGLRGRVKAYDAKNGKLKWVFYTVPAPGDVGGGTWPQGDAWTRGGGAVWQTPAIDPALGLLFFSVGNPGPNSHGIERPGDNLFTSSIVAVEAKSGKYRWHFQQVHHDLWDYDSANPVILFDTLVAGQPRKGIVEVSKTGWAYILDRETGKPLIGIDERPVPQEPRQATAATQPYPLGEAIVPQEIPIPPEGARLEPATKLLPNDGRIFTPFWTEPVTVKPGARGGANWPPSSYDPTSALLYVCATDRMSTYQAETQLEQPKPNQLYVGGKTGSALANDDGIFAALDVRTNHLNWRQQWREGCFSGSIVTHGGLVFVGRSDGRLTALDKDNGAKLWEFKTDAGVNSTATTFALRGKQYVVVVAGGNTLAGSRHGDSVWMFSLDGTILAAQPAAPAASAAPTIDHSRTADIANGRVLYRQACVACHGEGGEGGIGGGAPLTGGIPPATIIEVATRGRNNMPSFKAVYTEVQLEDIAGYIQQTLARQAGH